MSEIFLAFVEENAQKKKKTSEEWFGEKMTEKSLSSCRFATHIGKYTNPTVKAILLDKKANTDKEGRFVATSTADCQPDVFLSGGAASAPVGKLAVLELEDGKTVYEHLLADDNFIRDDVEKLGADYDVFRENLLKLSAGAVGKTSSKNLKQVFFPVKDGEYHLLTVMPPSCVIQTVHKKVQERKNAFFEQMKERKKVERETEINAGEGVEIVKEEIAAPIQGVTIRYGSSKPVNIASINNNRVSGYSTMLLAKAPSVGKRKVRHPKNSFFRESLWAKRDFAYLFGALHKLYRTQYNNKEIRDTLRDVEANIIERVLLRVYPLREEPAGWSEETNLSLVEKIWLDDKYKGLRDDKEWQHDIAERFASWMMDTYFYLNQEKSVSLEEGEFNALRKEIEEFVHRDFEMQWGN